MQQGWIKLHRKILDSAIWTEPHYLKLWTYCLLKASHKGREVIIGNDIFKINEGQFITGRKSLADDLNKGVKPQSRLSESTWYRYLTNLEKWQMLNIKRTSKNSIVTIVNWNHYQQDEQHLNSTCTSFEHHLNTNKNVKNVKNDKEVIPYVEIVDYLNEKANKRFSNKTTKTRELIRARWNEGHKLDDFKHVVDICVSEWSGKTFANGKKGDDYLQPSTLFNGKFDERLNWTRNKSNQVDDIKRVDATDYIDSLGGI